MYHHAWLLDGLHSELDTAKESVKFKTKQLKPFNLKYRQKQKKKKIEQNQQHLRDVWDNTKQLNTL
jgi:hypothetical protein